MKDELDFLPSAFRSSTYILTTKEGIRYEISGTTGDLMTVSDTNGNTLTFTDAGITSNTGATVTFERDAQNRITSVIDPLGQKVSYRYDANGGLIAVTDRATNTTQFEHDRRPRSTVHLSLSHLWHNLTTCHSSSSRCSRCRGDRHG